MQSTHLITILSFSLLCVGCLAGCEDYIHSIPDYTCLQSELDNNSKNGVSFLVTKNDVKYFMKVQPNDRKGRRELKILKKMRGAKNVSQLVKYKVDNFQNLIMVLSYGEKGSLVDFLATSKELSTNPKSLLNFVSEILTGVSEIYQRGYVHTDIKLENIIVDKQGKPEIIDFDLAVKTNTRVAPRGSPSYMAPEVVLSFQNKEKREYTGAEDMYSVGVIMFIIMNERYPIEMDGFDYQKMIDSEIVFGNKKEGKFVNFESYSICASMLRLKNRRKGFNFVQELISAGLEDQEGFHTSEDDIEYSLNGDVVVLDLDNTEEINSLSGSEITRTQKEDQIIFKDNEDLSQKSLISNKSLDASRQTIKQKKNWNILEPKNSETQIVLDELKNKIREKYLTDENSDREQMRSETFTNKSRPHKITENQSQTSLQTPSAKTIINKSAQSQISLNSQVTNPEIDHTGSNQSLSINNKTILPIFGDISEHSSQQQKNQKPYIVNPHYSSQILPSSNSETVLSVKNGLFSDIEDSIVETIQTHVPELIVLVVVICLMIGLVAFGVWWFRKTNESQFAEGSGCDETVVERELCH